MNIVLTGFMGTGKSVTGRWLAKELNLDFLDSDELIEKKEGIKISEIFSTKGEPYFREVESLVIREIVAGKDGLVLATGGGAFLNENNFTLLSNWGITVRLTADIDIIYSRVKGKKVRPLLDGKDLRSDIEKIIKEREPIYSKAEIKVDTSFKSVEEVTCEIIDSLKSCGGDC